MSRFGEALGIWEKEINGVTYKLEPTMEDILEFRKAISQATNMKTRQIDLGILDQSVMKLFEKFVLKAEPSLNLQERKELRDYIAIHLSAITDEMMVVLKQTTKENIEKAKEELLEEDKKKI